MVGQVVEEPALTEEGKILVEMCIREDAPKIDKNAVFQLSSLSILGDKAGMLSAEQSLAVQACALPPLPHEAVGSFIGLLLAFRTSQAYDRFWEARKQWGIVTTECRALASLACTYITSQQVM